MSKNALYLVVVCALAVTGLTFLVSRNGTQKCSTSVTSGADETAMASGVTNPTAGKEVTATVHGYPYWYYQEPFPAGCISANNTSAVSSLNVQHLGSDLLIWLLVCLVSVLGVAGYKAWRGPQMLGDNMRRV